MECSKYEGVIGDRIQSVAKQNYRVKLSLHHIYLSSTNNDVDVRLAFSSKKLAEISTWTLDKLTEQKFQATTHQMACGPLLNIKELQNIMGRLVLY